MFSTSSPSSPLRVEKPQGSASSTQSSPHRFGLAEAPQAVVRVFCSSQPAKDAVGALLRRIADSQSLNGNPGGFFFTSRGETFYARINRELLLDLRLSLHALASHFNRGEILLT